MKFEKIISQPFFKTKPLDCSYIKGNHEERLLLPIKGEDHEVIFEKLTKLGFRRNIDYMYLPVCKYCSKCVSTRISVNGFKPSKSQKRIFKKNNDFSFKEMIKNKKDERFNIFRKYLRLRHSDGMMLKMSLEEFEHFFYNAPTDSIIYDIMTPSNKLIGSILLDVMTDGMSAVYSFFDPYYYKNSLGIYLILKSIEKVQKSNKKFLYLGYWVKDSKKMNYKISFNNLELFMDGSWVSSSK